MTHPNKSLHLKSRTILNSNRYEPAEPNPTTPPANERPRNEHPPTNTRPTKTRPTKTRHTNTTRRQNPTIRQPSTGKQSSRQTKLSKPHTHFGGSFPSAKTHPTRDIAYHTPASAGTFYCVKSDPTNAQIRPRQNTDHAAPIPPILDFPQHI
ncbi:hypothetical protein BS47DRAFT_1364013 [Hydnum rufescens UP504]|uniref:Uncharacterized protein n=1 Tax=Hydnum rufescens UP504 TaxID=1448309 RepID=A0A9P6ASL7_9AGAM|nr:hypothetical protein BS47DRAFT_1364013 [Hydnum rufescens UP504]